MTDCTTILRIDSNTGVVTVSSDLETSASNFSECILTVKAEDNAIKRRSTTTALTVVLIPVPITTSPESVSMRENLVEGTVIANPSCSEIGPSSGPLNGSLQGTFSRYFQFNLNNLPSLLFVLLTLKRFQIARDPSMKSVLCVKMNMGLQT